MEMEIVEGILWSSFRDTLMKSTCKACRVLGTKQEARQRRGATQQQRQACSAGTLSQVTHGCSMAVIFYELSGLTWYLGDGSRGGVVREEKGFPTAHYYLSAVAEESSGVYRHLVEANAC
jgi:hypothetical protein